MLKRWLDHSFVLAVGLVAMATGFLTSSGRHAEAASARMLDACAGACGTLHPYIPCIATDENCNCDSGECDPSQYGHGVNALDLPGSTCTRVVPVEDCGHVWPCSAGQPQPCSSTNVCAEGSPPQQVSGWQFVAVSGDCDGDPV